jgi:hypothetical protein
MFIAAVKHIDPDTPFGERGTDNRVKPWSCPILSRRDLINLWLQLQKRLKDSVSTSTYGNAKISIPVYTKVDA